MIYVENQRGNTFMKSFVITPTENDKNICTNF